MVRAVERLGVLFVALMFLFSVCGCVSSAKTVSKGGTSNPKENKEVVFIPEKELPRKVVVLFPFPVGDVKVGAEFKRMLRGVLQNYLAGKGYSVRYADNLPASLKNMTKPDVKKAFSALAGIDGLFIIKVYSFSGVNAVFVKNYKLDAELCLYTKEKKLGCWRDSVSRRSVSISTDPLGIAAQVVGAVLSDTTTTKMKTLIMEWAYNVSALVPGFSEYEKKPKIFRVITNVSEKPFKMGDRLVVAVEGDPSMKATFDIGTFKSGIPMVESSKPGIYQGVYVVQKGDEATNQYIVVRLENSRGDKSEWLELEPPVNIDGVPPKPPVDVTFQVSDGKVMLKWRCVDGTTKAFRIYRSLQPLSGYKLIAETADLKFEDLKAQPGKTYYYRIVAVDSVGNESDPYQLGPVEVPVSNVALNGTVEGDLKPGVYVVGTSIVVPVGKRFVVGSGVVIKVSSNATIKVCGTMELKGSIEVVNGTYGGVEVCPSGTFLASDVSFKGADKVLLKGKATFNRVTFEDVSNGITVAGDASVEFSGCLMKGMKRALYVEDGVVKIIESTFRRNKVALWVAGGQVSVVKTNFLSNELDIKGAGGSVIVKDSYLGTDDPVKFNVEGNVKILSYLTLPYPDGEVVKYDEKKIEEEGKKYLKEGIRFVREGNYGKALELLEKAHGIIRTKEVYYWLVYVYTMMEEEGKLKGIIEEALKRYPYEVNIYQLAIRYYIFKGKYNEAEKLLNRALKLQPNNPTLESLKALLESMQSKTTEKGGGKDESK